MDHKKLFRTLTSCALPAGVLALMLLGSASRAQVIQLTTPGSLNAKDFFAAYPQTQGFNTTGNVYTLTPGSLPYETLTFTNNGSFQRQDQAGPGSNGGIWAGDFLPGTPQSRILRNVSSSNGAAGALTMNFNAPLSEVGFLLNPTAGIVDYTLNVFENNSSTSALTLTTEGTQQNSGGGTVPPLVFFGVLDTGGDKITSITLSGTPALNQPTNIVGDDFGISPLTIGSSRIYGNGTPVPEPGVVALMSALCLPATRCFTAAPAKPKTKASA